MAEGLEFDIKADVSDAVKGLQRVETELGKTGKAASEAAKKMPALTKNTGQANVALVNFGRVVQDAPFGLIGIANNIDPLLSSFQNLKRETGSTGSAFKALFASLAGPAGIAIAVSAVTSAFIAFGPQIQKMIEGANSFGKALDEAGVGAADQAIKINILTEALKSGTLTAKEQEKAQKELIKISPEFKDAFSGGAASVDKLDAALKKANARLLEQIKISAATKVLQGELEKLVTTVAKGGDLSFFDKLKSGLKGALISPIAPQIGATALNAGKAAQSVNEAQKEIADFGARINEVFKALGISFSSYVQNYEVGAEKIKKKAKEIFFEFTELQRVQTLSKLPELKAQVPTRQPGEGGVQQTQGQALDAARRLDFLIKSIKFDKQIAQAAELQSIIDGGINSGIDQFFNALANNQNPFDALIQGVKRLVVELIAAVAKALILKAITSGITGGASNLSSIAKTAGGATLLGGIPHFATGGFVSQPTMATIAENGPEFVLRPDQLGAIMNMGGGSDIIPEIKLRGEDMFIMLNRVQKRRGRNF